ncbi:carbohydrate ABC transporter permease [Photobacterium atrarenae]|uniref:Carbohydrate ABC transporter permease n=1 Tax=Photobacterium atrarenae TaxID=865757 RepID=A0ABY5GK81_9GAMM|nr:carbohydrate ABC transporter permease [Photobacterium atrarenae]UTV29642.1 carbohydrate ABC transporter permease [Photobacterium atrarenae]
MTTTTLSTRHGAKSIQSRIGGGKLLVYGFMLLATVATILPFIWMILTSVKTQSEALSIPPQVFPQTWQLSAYEKIIAELPFVQFYINSVLVTLAIVLLQTLIAAMAAYGFARLRFPGRDAIFLICVSILMVPGQIFLIPQFLIVQKMGLLNTLTGLVLPGLFSIYGAFLLRQFFISVPKEIEEAAIVDGLNHFQIFYKIMLPLIRPGIIACVIINGLWSWNNLMWPLIVNTSFDKMTLPVGLASLSSRAGVEYPMLMAGALMAIVPMLLLYMVFQKQFIEGAASAGVKG